MSLRRLADGRHALEGVELEARLAAEKERVRAAGAGPGVLRDWQRTTDVDGVLEFLALADAAAVVAPLRVDAPSPPSVGSADALLEGISDPCLFLRTSGTTGTPRGVVLTRSGIDAHIDAVSQRLELRAEDAWGATLSPAHVGGAMLLLRAHRIGCSVECFDGFDPPAILERIEAGRLTHLSVVPTMLLRLLDHLAGRRAPEGLRAVLVGGAHAPPDLLLRAIDAGVPVAATWGMSEMSSQVATATPAETAVDPESVGRPLPGVSVQVGTGGELRVRGPARAARRVQFDADGVVEDPLLSDGWFATGDLGTIDAEGRIRVTGRLGDRIISGGVNVDPHAVEATLRGIPGVRAALVVGLPDPEWGERVAALVQVTPEIELSQLEDDLRPLLSPAERPRRIELVNELPLNPNGKPDRAAARRLLGG